MKFKCRVWVESVVSEETGMYTPDYISLISNDGEGSIDKVYTPEFKFKSDTCEFTLLLSTGVKDAEGTEIFAGDVLELPEEHGWLATPGLSVVEWDDEYARWGGACFAEAAGYSRVIGNIYENPELLDEPTV
jgi:hypothetical protein